MATKTKKFEKYRCSCGCKRKVDRVTERRHLNPEQAPLYARVAQFVTGRVGRTGLAAQKLWQQAIDRLSPRPSPQLSQESPSAGNNAPMAMSPLPTASPFPAAPSSSGSPMPLSSPPLPHTPQMSTSPHQTAEATLQSRTTIGILRTSIEEDDEEESGEGSEDSDSEEFSNEGSKVEGEPVDDDEDLARMHELWEEYDRLSHRDMSDSGDEGDEQEAYNQSEGHAGEDGMFWDTTDLPSDLRELIAHLTEKLEVSDTALLRVWNYKLKHNVTDTAFDDLRYTFPEYTLPTAKTARRRINYLAKFKPEVYDCCINVCMLYAGLYAELEDCLYCDEPRRQHGKARKHFSYIPLLYRLRSFYMNAAMIEKMKYRHRFEAKEGIIQDYCDGLIYKSLLNKRITVGDVQLDDNYFQHETDIALGLFTDGFSPFKNRKQTCWPLLIMNMNLPPDERCLVENMICVGVIPGPRKPKNADSFLFPFTAEMLELTLGVDAFHIVYKLPFSLRAFITKFLLP